MIHDSGAFYIQYSCFNLIKIFIVRIELLLSAPYSRLSIHDIHTTYTCTYMFSTTVEGIIYYIYKYVYVCTNTTTPHGKNASKITIFDTIINPVLLCNV